MHHARICKRGILLRYAHLCVGPQIGIGQVVEVGGKGTWCGGGLGLIVRVCGYACVRVLVFQCCTGEGMLRVTEVCGEVCGEGVW